MTFILPENVQETSTTEGLGPITLLGAVPGHLPYDSQLSNGDTTIYTISEGITTETGYGTFNDVSGNILTRDTVLFSTAANAKINWGVGTRNVFVALSGKQLASLLDPSSGYGLLANTALNTFERRTLAGVAGQIVITNGNGVENSPIVGLANPPSDFMKTLLDDSAASEFWTTLLGARANGNHLVVVNGEPVWRPQFYGAQAYRSVAGSVIIAWDYNIYFDIMQSESVECLSLVAPGGANTSLITVPPNVQFMEVVINMVFSANSVGRRGVALFSTNNLGSTYAVLNPNRVTLQEAEPAGASWVPLVTGPIPVSPGQFYKIGSYQSSAGPLDIVGSGFSVNFY